MTLLLQFPVLLMIPGSTVTMPAVKYSAVEISKQAQLSGALRVSSIEGFPLDTPRMAEVVPPGPADSGAHLPTCLHKSKVPWAPGARHRWARAAERLFAYVVCLVLALPHGTAPGTVSLRTPSWRCAPFDASETGGGGTGGGGRFWR